MMPWAIMAAHRTDTALPQQGIAMVSAKLFPCTHQSNIYRRGLP